MRYGDENKVCKEENWRDEGPHCGDGVLASKVVLRNLIEIRL
jgi:hypothetical protein